MNVDKYQQQLDSLVQRAAESKAAHEAITKRQMEKAFEFAEIMNEPWKQLAADIRRMGLS